ncbi:MAG: PKD domain-containing protein [Bacteroidota bacterium]
MRCLFLLAAFYISTHIVFAQPIANFAANQTSGCLPLVVSFQDQSTNAVSWYWETGIGTSTLQNPGVFYNTPGVYSITLIVTDAQGLTDTLVRENWIEVYEYPIADFSVDNQEVCTFEPISFSDLSLPGSGQIISWIWDFGDGNTSTDPNPIHSYEGVGEYPVSLQIQNQYGCSDDVIVQDMISIKAPDASFSGDDLLACGPPLVVNFTSLGDTAGTHTWEFGTGQSSSLIHPTHVFHQNGSFSVTHIVEDADGCRDTVTLSNYVNIGVNTLSIYAQDSSLCLGDTTFLFTNASTNSQVIWDFGDGDSTVGLTPYHIFDSAGVYSVTATISDQSGCLNTLSLPIEVFAYPSVDFTVQDTTLGCSVPFQVDFLSITSGGLQYIWAFGDGDSAFTPNPSHTYQSVDSFKVSLIVIGPGGCLKEKKRRDYIKIREIDSGFLAEPRGGCVPLYVQFYDTTHSPYPLTNWSWDFGNGTTSTNQYPSHTFQDTGFYDISLVVTNSRGCTDTTFREDHIAVGMVPHADFTIDTNQACSLLPIQLNNQSSGASQFFWYFSDGDTSMATHPIHGFGGFGYMDVMLIASDRGCTDTVLKEDIIYIFEPFPVIGISERSICQLPRDVTFTNMSLGADAWSWVIDDSIPSSDPAPVHTFTTDGTHYVELTVENFATGCKVTVLDSLFIQDIKANFVPDTNRSCIPFTLRFNDMSTNAIDWWWDFGTGDTSVQASPKYTYKEVGDYEVRLIALNELECADTMVYQYIHALDVNADFRLLDTAGCVPFGIDLIDESSGTGAVVNWQWDLGDGTLSSASNPSHVYTVGNNYTISLTVTDVDGCVDSLKKEDHILATQPIPEFLVNPHVNCPDYSSVFVSLSSGVGLSYWWDFGDGAGSWLANTTHAYQDTGMYTITLSVTDVNGCDSSITSVNHVVIQELEAIFWADTTFANCPPLAVSFVGDTTYPHIGVNWYWDFGDGATSTQAFPTHIYSSPGVYTVSLILESAGGCADTTIIQDMIVIEGPTGEFSFGPQLGCPGTEVYFDAESADSIGYEWLFGDGIVGSGQTTNHMYSQAGAYVPILVMEDTLGCRVFNISPDTIYIHEPPNAMFTADKELVCDSGFVTFIDQSSGVNRIQSWWWDFGDGDTSIQQFPQHFYNQAGTYDVTLIITDVNGCKDTMERIGFILVSPSPDIGLLSSDSVGCAPLIIQLDGTVQAHPYPISSWEWDFGYGGNQALGQQATTSYPEAGTYQIQLVGIDTKGCQDTSVMQLEVWPLPEPDFFVSDSVGCAPSIFYFTSIDQADIVQWEWNFGDGHSASTSSVSHTYQNNGAYTVSLQQWDTNGCSRIVSKDDLIRLDPPLPAFGVSQQIICPGIDLQFFDQSESDLPIVSWEWDFGDGQISHLPNPIHAYVHTGAYSVKLVVEDSYGCVDSIEYSQYITVLLNEVPDLVDIHTVNVEDHQSIRIEFAEYLNDNNDFGAYWIYREDPTGQFQLVGTIDHRTKTSFVDQGIQPETRIYCYKILVVNHCGLSAELPQATAHCQANLSARGGKDEVHLSWTPYVGWHRVKAYHIFRTTDYRPAKMTFVASVPGGTLDYLDTELFCYDVPAYRIIAESDEGYEAYSDTAVALPEHSLPTEPTHISRVSVEDNDFVLVEWDSAAIRRADQVVVMRKAGNQFHELFRQRSVNTEYKYQDTSSVVSRQSYTYRVFTQDSCGDLTPLGRQGTTIHLQAEEDQGRSNLKWNPYQGWEHGVEKYTIEAYDESSQQFELIGEVPGIQHRFSDEQTNWEQPIICYRITAHEMNGEDKLSLSNEDCVVLRPQMYSANAFTPNGDNINDEFGVDAVFLTNYHLRIYNRWGILVFESASTTSKWNGRMPDGSLAAEGVYVFVTEGRGFDGAQVKRVGSVTLIR